MSRLRMLTILVATAGFGCGLSPDTGSSLAQGTAVVESGVLSSEKRLCSAYATTKQLGDTEFEAIVLELPSGMTLEILGRDFSAAGVGTESGEDPGFVLASLHDRGTGKHYLAETAAVTMVESGKSVRGRFDFGMRDALSSCMYCPGTWIEVQGEFHAVLDAAMVTRRGRSARRSGNAPQGDP